MATWSASDDSSSDEETSTEQANLCLMAHENEVNSATPIDFIFEEFHEAFYDLLKEFQKVVCKNKDLKIRCETFKKENSEFIKIIDTLKNEKDTLQKEISKLKPIVDKFTLSSEKLQLMLNNQK